MYTHRVYQYFGLPFCKKSALVTLKPILIWIYSWSLRKRQSTQGILSILDNEGSVLCWVAIGPKKWNDPCRVIKKTTRKWRLIVFFFFFSLTLFSREKEIDVAVGDTRMVILIHKENGKDFLWPILRQRPLDDNVSGILGGFKMAGFLWFDIRWWYWMSISYGSCDGNPE